jgi:DNA-binding LytR/AlgR family response regulator
VDQSQHRLQLRLIPIEDVLFFQSDEKYTLVATKEFRR